jgi:hypothetical protein
MEAEAKSIGDGLQICYQYVELQSFRALLVIGFSQ